MLNKTNLDSIFVFSLWHKTRKTGNISFCDRTISVITDELKNENYDEISDFTSATLLHNMSGEWKVKINSMFWKLTTLLTNFEHESTNDSRKD